MQINVAEYLTQIFNAYCKGRKFGNLNILVGPELYAEYEDGLAANYRYELLPDPYGENPMTMPKNPTLVFKSHKLIPYAGLRGAQVRILEERE